MERGPGAVRAQRRRRPPRRGRARDRRPVRVSEHVRLRAKERVSGHQDRHHPSGEQQRLDGQPHVGSHRRWKRVCQHQRYRQHGRGAEGWLHRHQRRHAQPRNQGCRRSLGREGPGRGRRCQGGDPLSEAQRRRHARVRGTDRDHRHERRRRPVGRRRGERQQPGLLSVPGRNRSGGHRCERKEHDPRRYLRHRGLLPDYRSRPRRHRVRVAIQRGAHRQEHLGWTVSPTHAERVCGARGRLSRIPGEPEAEAERRNPADGGQDEWRDCRPREEGSRSRHGKGHRGSCHRGRVRPDGAGAAP